MKSGSWSSFQAAAELPDREDEPTPETIPASVTVGQRFAEKTGGAWNVFDWEPDWCDCMKTHGDQYGPTPEPACKSCNGTGNGPLVPERIASDVSDADARLLVFGNDLLAACEEMLRTLTCPSRQLADITRAELRPWLPMLQEVVAKAKGYRILDCDHQWGIDGAHSNEYCKRCFVSRPKS